MCDIKEEMINVFDHCKICDEAILSKINSFTKNDEERVEKCNREFLNKLETIIK